MTRSRHRERLGGVLVDWDANRGRPQIQCALALLRISQRSRSGGGGRSPGALLTAALYRTFALGVCSLDIPVSTRVGPRLQIHHGMGLVVHSGAVLGADVVLRQSTTIGSSRSGGAAPRLGDRVSVGPNVVVLGDITLGDGVVVGAGAVVLKDAAPGTVLVGNPARALAP